MDMDLEKCIIEFIVARCTNALQESGDYTKLQGDDCSKEEILDTALMIGYRKGASDMFNMFKYLQPKNTAKEI